MEQSTVCRIKRRNSRGTSTKTRIETGFHLDKARWLQIQEAHPLKQGLKLFSVAGFSTDNYPIQEAHPLKQGLVNSRVYQTNYFATYFYSGRFFATINSSITLLCFCAGRPLLEQDAYIGIKEEYLQIIDMEAKYEI